MKKIDTFQKFFFSQIWMRVWISYNSTTSALNELCDEQSLANSEKCINICLVQVADCVRACDGDVTCLSPEFKILSVILWQKIENFQKIRKLTKIIIFFKTLSSQCYRAQATCEANCPCYDNCFDGCPCDTFKCEFVCLTPTEESDSFEEYEVSDVTLNLNQGDFVGKSYHR